MAINDYLFPKHRLSMYRLPRSPSSLRLVYRELNSTTASSYTTGSLASFSVANVYAVVVTSRISAGVSGGPQLPTVTGCGLTWTNQVSKETSGATPNRRVSLVIGRGNPSPGALTMAFNAESQTLCHVQALEVSNCACVVQSTSANDGGVTGTTATVTLGAVSTYTDNITLGVVLVTSGLSPSVPKIPGAGFGSLDELYENVAGTSVFIEHKRGAQTASATWTGSNAWVILAAELQNKLALDFSF